MNGVGPIRPAQKRGMKKHVNLRRPAREYQKSVATSGADMNHLLPGDPDTHRRQRVARVVFAAQHPCRLAFSVIAHAERHNRALVHPRREGKDP